MSIVQIPLRLTTGAFVLNSGLNKRKLTDEQAEGLRQMAEKGLPAVKDMDAATFRRFLTYSEIGVGAALLLPVVPGWVAGTALSAFSAGLVNMYLNTPEMTEDDGVRPSQEGTSVAKDVIMLGAGVAVTLDSLVNRKGSKRKAAAKRARKISDAKSDKVEAIQEAAADRVDAINQAREEQVEALRKARKDLKAQRKGK